MNRYALVWPLLLAGLVGCQTSAGRHGSASPVPPPPIDPPAGYRWVLNEPLSDEFDGTGLDRGKWLDHYPGWEGRVPGKFVPESISVADGTLQIRSHVLDTPRGDEGQWTLGCGAIQSRSMTALYGYYEARIKTSNVRTSTTFWMKNDRGERERPYKLTELDVMEAIGNAERWPAFATHIKSNTHIEYFPEDPGAESTNLKKGGTSLLPDGGRSHDRFRTYGCWWVDANTMHFYVDGELVHTVEPSTELDPAPMDQPMFINAVCEIYTWELPPEEANLRDETRNTSYYDYIRAYRLEKIEPEKEGRSRSLY